MSIKFAHLMTNGADRKGDSCSDSTLKGVPIQPWNWFSVTIRSLVLKNCGALTDGHTHSWPVLKSHMRLQGEKLRSRRLVEQEQDWKWTNSECRLDELYCTWLMFKPSNEDALPCPAQYLPSPPVSWWGGRLCRPLQGGLGLGGFGALWWRLCVMELRSRAAY